MTLEKLQQTVDALFEAASNFNKECSQYGFNAQTRACINIPALEQCFGGLVSREEVMAAYWGNTTMEGAVKELAGLAEPRRLMMLDGYRNVDMEA